jgi:8-oxo-dGTP diphosphatase
MKNYKYCPYCGSSNKKYKYYFLCTKCKKKIYINSHPAVSAFVIKNGKYLISKRAIAPKKGHYDAIGGFLNNSEHPEAGIIREFKEETGLTINIIELIGIYMDKYEYQDDLVSTLIFCYLVKIIKGKINPQDDVDSLHWFPIEKVPDNLAFPWIKKALRDIRNKYK